MDPFVPKHDPLPLNGQACAYSPTPGSGYCGRPATWHVMWDGAMDNSFTCDEHMDLIQQRWVFDDRHPVVADCGMPGALWSYKDGHCFVPDSPVMARGHACGPRRVSGRQTGRGRSVLALDLGGFDFPANGGGLLAVVDAKVVGEFAEVLGGQAGPSGEFLIAGAALEGADGCFADGCAGVSDGLAGLLVAGEEAVVLGVGFVAAHGVMVARGVGHKEGQAFALRKNLVGQASGLLTGQLFGQHNGVIASARTGGMTHMKPSSRQARRMIADRTRAQRAQSRIARRNVGSLVTHAISVNLAPKDARSAAGSMRTVAKRLGITGTPVRVHAAGRMRDGHRYTPGQVAAICLAWKPRKPAFKTARAQLIAAHITAADYLTAA